MSWDPLNLGGQIGEFFGDFFTSVDEVVSLAQIMPNGQMADGSPGTIESFPADSLWNTATGISMNCTAPIAVVFLGIFLSMEIFNLATRTRTENGIDFVYQILMSVLKMAICIFFIENMSTLILACFQVSGAIIKNISYFNTTINYDSQTLIDGVKEHYESGSFFDWSLLIDYISVWLAKTGAQICAVIAKLVLMIRFIEIYVFTAAAPIAFATLPSSEYSGIGKNFIKRLLALGLQGVMIVICCSLYLTIVNAYVGGANIYILEHPVLGGMQLFGYNLLLVIVLFQTGGWSKQLLQVH